MAKKDMWEIQVSHQKLNKYRSIRGSDRFIVEQKASAQKLIWEEMWQKKVLSEKKSAARESQIRNKEQKKELAALKTEDAQNELDCLDNILTNSLSVNNNIDWASLIQKNKFPMNKPQKPSIQELPKEPQKTDSKYKPKLNLFDKIFRKRREAKENSLENMFFWDKQDWHNELSKIKEKNKQRENQYKIDLSNWEVQKKEFEQNQEKNNQKISDLKDKYYKLDPEAVTYYCDMILSQSIYPEYFPQTWDLEYQENSKMLVIDYSLPDIESLPTLKSVKYVATKDEFVESFISESNLNKIYDNLLYQISLRTIHEIFESDSALALDMLVFNGWVCSMNKATGQEVRACILSLQTSKDEYLAINLKHVDPKSCFKQLKGVGSSKLHGLSPVAPIIAINKEDHRFVSPYTVVNGLKEADNLAAMDWQDFENLIREIFEKEFATSGGEVKITQASRDGGVDAIAFDPDPIRGGKIVIQAKRYTNVVGVSSVRDLYGTTLNEGATKGILVTTADFGPDAYEFIKGKPLTLLNGSNLLHLLEKHGHKAKIDLQEAKKILNGKSL